MILLINVLSIYYVPGVDLSTPVSFISTHTSSYVITKLRHREMKCFGSKSVTK